MGMANDQNANIHNAILALTLILPPPSKEQNLSGMLSLLEKFVIIINQF